MNAGTGGGDQVYVTWRNFDATDQDPALVCTQDSGANWTATPVNVGAGAFPRINVGQDGFVYVVYLDGGNYMLNKYSSCATGLVQQPGFPVAVTTRSPVTCPFPGHDRCDQNPSSQMIAVDDTNPNHVYFVYGHNLAANNDDIRLRDSLDGGATWPALRFVRINGLISAHRIMPWICTTGGEAFVTWYDRRAAPPTNNDLTDYYGGSTRLDAGGNLVVGPEFKISEVPDSWCASGWPCGTRSTGDSEQCAVQPQQAGVCCGPATPTNNCPGSNQRCDFSDMNCPAGETCSTSGGCPKYGDYNGNACAAGRLLAAYASMATPLSVQPPSNSISVLFSSQIVGDVPRIQVPGDVSFANTCVGSTSTATLNVCNTGNTNLEIAPAISSSNSQFSVTTPSGGFPVVISPDFCFPFQVRFTPTSTGNKTANLTIQSNDPSIPSVVVQATGQAAQQNIATFIANSGDFGNVCVGSFKDLDLTINNSGGCDLSISNITSSSPEFKTAQTLSFPLVVQGGTSLHVPIRFQPTSTGAKAANITIVTNDPDTPNKVVAVTGHSDAGDVRVTGSTDFGDVCAGALVEKTIQVCNVGTCDLHVTSASLGSCTDFQIVNNPFPATISHDSCVGFGIRFTPTSAGPKSCTLTLNTDDPDTPSIVKTVTANTPLASIDVSPDQSFLPEVVQSAGTCRSLQPFPISNKGTCNLTITNITTGGINGTDFGTFGLPSFPIILQPGHTVGDGNFMTVFAPTLVDRDRLGTLSVTYESDPITHATVQVVRNLCGEGVMTGARVLVKAGGVPLSSVEKIQLNRITGNRNKHQVDSVDNAMNLALQTVTPAPPCGAFQYHREFGTVSNPIQLLPGSYVVTVTAIVNGKRRNLTVAFDITTCDFNPTIIVNFP